MGRQFLFHELIIKQNPDEHMVSPLMMIVIVVLVVILLVVISVVTVLLIRLERA